jgi:coenzyme F420-reducing hydrogenase beta subunit
MEGRIMLVYAVKHKDENIIANSRSGGMFTAISDLILREDGICYGCVLDDHLKAVHKKATSKEERNLMRGSKYIQSILGDTYKNVKADLNADRKVLFSGTSCEVSGLKSFLGKEYTNLLCVDIACHGVPSPKVFSKYIAWNGAVENIDFRNKKKFGWREHVETLTTERGEKRIAKFGQGYFMVVMRLDHPAMNALINQFITRGISQLLIIGELKMRLRNLMITRVFRWCL